MVQNQKTFPGQRNERNWQVSRNQQMVGFELTRKTYEQQIIHKPQGSMGLFFSAMVFNEILRKAWATNTKEKHRNYKLKMKSLSDLWETKSKHKNWRCCVEVISSKDLMAHDFKEKSWKRWFVNRNGKHSNSRIFRRSIVSRGQLREDLQE